MWNSSLHTLHQQRSGRLTLWLVLAGLLLRAMIPDGFMPERREGTGGVALAFCYASPLAKLRADHGAPTPAHEHSQCVFAAATGPALLAATTDEVHAYGGTSGPVEPYAPLTLSLYSKVRPPVRGPPAFS